MPFAEILRRIVLEGRYVGLKTHPLR
jgi:hypothetical protein